MQTRNIALSGLMTALALTTLLLGGLIGIGTYAAPLLAGILLLPIGRRIGIKWHILMVSVIAVLSFILVPDMEENLMFLLFFGWYPILYPRLHTLQPVLRTGIKLLTFNTCIITAEALLLFVLMPASDPPILLLALLLLGNVVFLLYDKSLPRMDFLLEKLIQRIYKG